MTESNGGTESKDPNAGRHPKAVAFEQEGIQALGSGTARVVTSTFLWAALMFFFGAVCWTALYTTGLLDADSPFWSILAWILLPTYMVAGAVVGAFMGTWRGIGLAMLLVGVEKGMVIYLLERTLNKIAELIRKSDRAGAAADKAQEMAENLPLQTWEEKLKQAVDHQLGTDDASTSTSKGKKGPTYRLMKKIRKTLYRRIELYLLAIVRQETDAQGRGGGVSVAKVRNIAFDRAEKTFRKFIDSFITSKMKLAFIGLVIVFAIAPLVARFG